MANSRIKRIPLPEVIDERGSLTFLESNNHVPFEIKYTLIVTNVVAYSKNARFSRSLEKQFLVILSGVLRVKVRDGEFEKVYVLRKPNEGLYVPEEAEKSVIDFSENLLLLVLGN